MCTDVLLERKVVYRNLIGCSISCFILFSGLTNGFASASLPWQGLKAGNKKQKYEKISERKIATSTEVRHNSLMSAFTAIGILVFIVVPQL